MRFSTDTGSSAILRNPVRGRQRRGFSHHHHSLSRDLAEATTELPCVAMTTLTLCKRDQSTQPVLTASAMKNRA